MIEYIEKYTERENLIYAPLWWHKQGLTQTSTGYGKKLTTFYKIKYMGRLYRVYACAMSNVASYYIRSKGKDIYLNIIG